MSASEDLADAIELDADLKADGRLISIGSIATGSYVEQHSIYALPTKASLRPDGDNIKIDDKWFLVSGLYDLTTADRVVDDGIEYSIINVFPMKPSTQTIFNKIQARV